MIHFKSYARPESLQEAYDLCQKKKNVIVGGMMWLKMEDLQLNTAIDLCKLDLNYIKEEEDCYRIGAMTPLRQVEKHSGLSALTDGALEESLRHIVGVQFRNGATVGGSIWGRFGFSDLATVLLALNASVVLYKAGEMPLEDFLKLSRDVRDILTEVQIPKKVEAAAYLSQRNISTDFPVVACGLTLMEGQLRCSLGARPGLAELHRLPADLLEASSEEVADMAKKLVCQVTFGSNLRASADYRQQVAAVLIERAVKQLKEVRS